MKTDKNHIIRYYTLEKYPIKPDEISGLDYASLFDDAELKTLYQKIHESAWETEVEILPNFFLTKYQSDFFQLNDLIMPPINLVYYDCFGARVQPDLWEKPLFHLVADKMATRGLLTTYSSKGSVRRVLLELGFEVEKMHGPPGKREMINAVKQD